MLDKEKLISRLSKPESLTELIRISSERKHCVLYTGYLFEDKNIPGNLMLVSLETETIYSFSTEDVKDAEEQYNGQYRLWVKRDSTILSSTKMLATESYSKMALLNVSAKCSARILCPTGRNSPGHYTIRGSHSVSIINNSDSVISVTISYGVEDDHGGNFSGSDSERIEANSRDTFTYNPFYNNEYPDENRDYIVSGQAYTRVSGGVSCSDESSCAFVITA